MKLIYSCTASGVWFEQERALDRYGYYLRTAARVLSTAGYRRLVELMVGI